MNRFNGSIRSMGDPWILSEEYGGSAAYSTNAFFIRHLE